MRNYLAIISLFFCISCANKEVEIQERAFNLLKSLDTLKFDGFLNSYYSLKAYKNQAIRDNIAKNYKDEILAITDSEWEYYRKKDYNNFLNQAANHQIVWKNIELEEFHYTENISYGMKCLDGTIFFSYKNELYEARVYTIDDGSKYQIFTFRM